MLGPIGYCFFCLPFVFHLFFFLMFPLSFPVSSLNYRTLGILLCGDASAPFIGFLLLCLAYVVQEGSKTGVAGFLW